MNKYTVLLLRPDYVADGFGQDTYLAHVTADTSTEALLAAREEVMKLDEIEDVEPCDYYPLFTTAGWHDDITDRES